MSLFQYMVSVPLDISAVAVFITRSVHSCLTYLQVYRAKRDET
jgi:hypothetical protein